MHPIYARRTALLAGAFAALLLVTGFSGFAIWRNATNAQAKISSLYNTHVEAETALASMRANVYLTGILTRDYLLDPQSGRAKEDKLRLQGIGNRISEEFRLLRSAARAAKNDDELAALDQLEKGVDAYWDSTLQMLDWPTALVRRQRSDFLRARVSRRDQIDQFAGKVEALMSSGFSRTKEQMAHTDLQFRSSLAWTACIALFLCIGIAGTAMFRMNKLERQSDLSQAELRRLSGQVRTAQEQERRLLSRELHDEVGQMLTGLRMELSGIARLNKSTSSEVAVRIGHAKGIVEKTLQVVRNIAMLLRPSMLDDLGLTPALTWLVKETARASGIQMEADIDSKLDSLPDSYRTCLFRVVQEALTNVAKHSFAAKATVSLRKTAAGWVTGIITDDGKGFDPSAMQREGIGLLGMRERVRELGGELHVISKPRQGTKIELRLPTPAWPEVIHDSYPDRGRSRDRSDRVETSA
jgi:signal transduction histidine kinase